MRPSTIAVLTLLLCALGAGADSPGERPDDVDDTSELLIRKDDVVCRFGGEEFLLICANTDLAGAKHVAQRLCTGVATNQIHVPGFEGNVKASVGVALRSPRMKSPQELLKAADEALYAAKRAGRNRACIAAT